MSKENNSQVLINKIKSLSDDYGMQLDWDKINNADGEELEHILGLIKRIYKLR